MTEHKEPKDEIHSENEYSFMQETIKDEVGSKTKAKKDIVRMVGLGVIFGVVASLSFCVTKPWLEEHLTGDKAEVEIPQEEEEEPEDAAEETEEVVTPDLGIDSYRQLQYSLTEIGNQAAKSVVEINGIVSDQQWMTDTYDTKNSTSGLIVADNGQELLIWGKGNVAHDVKRITVTFCDGKSYEASLKRKEGILGFGIYAVDRQNIQDSTWSHIQIATLGSTSSAVKGEPVIVLGSPFGYAGSMGFGTVASNKNVVGKADVEYRLICTDISAAANGSGVIVNVRGEVVGVIDQSISGESSMNLVTGYGISDIKSMIEQLSNGQGISYIGINGVDVTDEIEAQGVPKGVYVKGVETDSPAMTAGIQSGDIITEINGKDVTTLAEYHSALMDIKSGRKIALSGKRQGNGGYVDVDFSVTVGER